MRTHTVQDGTGVITRSAPDGIVDIYTNAAPTAGASGYAVGCFWRNKSGTVGAILYVNTGTKTSAVWTVIT